MGDARATIEALLPLLIEKQYDSHLAHARRHYRKTREGLDDLANGTPDSGLIHPRRHGSMANAMAQSIGAQAAFPGRQVISLSGDGGFAMLMGDLLSLRQLDYPVKVVVFNNGALGFIELEQKSTGFSISARNLRTRTSPRWLRQPAFGAFASRIRRTSRRGLPRH